MKFQKQPTTISEQLDLLKNRGMTIENEAFACECLRLIGYYRLSAYWLPYEKPPTAEATRSKEFSGGTSFANVHSVYVFDRNLRILLLEAIERIEIHIRARWVFYMCEKHGAHSHLDCSNFNGKVNHATHLTKLSHEIKRSSEVFIEHYGKKYSSPEIPPLWATAELMTFGQVSQWIVNTSDNSIRSKIARDLGFPTKETFEGTMQALTYVRNICAHHSRLWNRKLVKGPPYIKRLKDDLKTITTPKGGTEADKHIYNILVLVLHMINSQNVNATFKNRFVNLLADLDIHHLRMMGFPDDWSSRRIWDA
ncbi:MULTISPECIES: Abi family protein [Pacificibacter]|uniref:Abi family protein n=1 Tax=Pacificibacter TaxID=1042323 RepID=UPI001C09206E|nr:MULTISPECIES: Abi family protein [Pacificibacter]MBU2937202.1 Abi family protein [Pacificibacter marinus]MDO6615197.1 Abi family protein [Pacificibacter sp. 1_MG-2023]